MNDLSELWDLFNKSTRQQQGSKKGWEGEGYNPYFVGFFSSLHILSFQCSGALKRLTFFDLYFFLGNLFFLCVYACTHSKTWENLHLKYVEMLLYTIDFLVSGDGLVFDSSSGYIIQNNKTYFVTRQKLVFEKNQKPRSNLSEIRGKKIIFLLTLMKHFFFLGRMKLTLKIWSAPQILTNKILLLQNHQGPAGIVRHTLKGYFLFYSLLIKITNSEYIQIFFIIFIILLFRMQHKCGN